ncbi:MAG: hypothetical protein F9K40_04775 [Kofleriaceae bacterium]|nr:MAG: hypothetical protein F9K40_04775 [Kofleriaceae bacterium]MBZ0237661.1 hypothetical protein [Kofleriaceae bacterium]
MRSLALATVVCASLTSLIFGVTPAAAEPQDFGADAKVMYRVVACAGDAPLPAGIDARTIEAHCKQVQPWYEMVTRRYVTPARELFATVRPASLPRTVVYPFGGGDLLSALITYPDATEITTISLEHAGDPTRITAATPRQLKTALAVYRGAARALLTNHDSASENMQKLERGAVPGQLSFFITALAALGYEPVSLRFFTLQPDGTLDYLDAAEIAALSDTRAKRKKKSWVDTDYSEAFTNSELTFRKAGDPKAPLVTHRHIAANLANNAFPGSPLARHLEAKGKVATMTKAASYLLWLSNFSGIRDYLLAHSAWMISDSTGIPPRHAKRAGFKQTTYGKFAGSYLAASAAENEAFRKLWEGQRQRKLRFRYGYPDAEGNVHLMITEPRATP